MARPRLGDQLDRFPPGKAPLALFLIGSLAVLYLIAFPVRRPDADLRLWTFVTSNADSYREALPAFEADHPGTTVDVQMIQYFALQSRLRSAFWADLDVPDIVELEISHAGGFFRGAREDIGFIDLTPYLERDGLAGRLVPSRLAPYRNRGAQFGLPLDIHPVMLAYRRDLFEEYGIDPESLATWEDFIREGRRVRREHGRFMIQLADSNANYFEVLLFQNGGGYFDESGALVMDGPATLETLLWYIPLVAGDDRIGSDLGTDQVFAQALESGYFLCILAPDWLANHLEVHMPGVEGRMALMPLPAFEPGGRRTSTMGGTMAAITTGCEDPDLAWELLRALRFAPEAVAERYRQTGVLPPLRDSWELDVINEPRPYWSGQRTGALYASLGDQVPPQFASPHVSLAKTKMGDVVASCSARYRQQGPEGFEDFARERLARAADDVRRAMTRNPFQ